MHKITLITGGGRSGKSGQALSRAERYGSRAFIATAEPIDGEMQERIARHKQERADSFITIEEPIDLDAALRKGPAGVETVVVDCLAVWVGNLMHHCPSREHEFIDRFIDGIGKTAFDLILVTNEVGMGIVPDNEMSRQYRDLLGMVNQRIAVLAHEVVLMVSGIPLIIKGGDRE
jgi:adenosylcobinamide kinase / adenosylcobinamide-phosphate guanylyltransferase